MTKKDFELIASIIYRAMYQARQRKGQELIEQEIENISIDFADTLSGLYPRFESSRFLNACGVIGCANHNEPNCLKCK